MLYFPTSPN